MIKDVIHVSQNAAEFMQPDESWAFISITDSKDNRAGIKEGHSGLLRLAFFDDHTFKNRKNDPTFDENTAKEIINFTENLPKEVQHIVVHCAAGISRSAAVARYIAKRFHLSFDWDYDLYHRRVYQTLMKVKYGV